MELRIQHDPVGRRELGNYQYEIRLRFSVWCLYIPGTQ